jgi:hypothetical protein
MAEEGKGLALVILGIIAVIAVVGLVLLFSKASTTGAYVEAGTFVQFEPNEACERAGCTLKGVEGGTTYASQGPLMAVCDCMGREMVTPIVRPFDWREEYYPQG